VAGLGYNSIRTSVDLCGHHCIGSASGGLDPRFLDNIADLLGRARSHGLQVFLNSNDLPLDGGYVPRVEATTGAGFDGYMNSQYFSPVAYAVYRDYWVEIVKGLVARHAALDAVAGYQLRGEAFLFADKPPLSSTSGTVTTGERQDIRPVGSGRSASDARRRPTLLAGLDPVGDPRRRPDGIGRRRVFSAPNEPHPWRPPNDSRLVLMQPIFASTLDFVDIHAYPGYIPFEQLAEDLRLAKGDQSKPVIMGEFGAFTFAFSTPAAGASGVMAWQVASCPYGIDGWFHWHWQGVKDHEVWTGTEGDNVINRVLSPAERPDPCKPASLPYLETNLAFGRPVVVSAASPGKPGALAVDGLASTGWESGADPPGSIEIQLGGPSSVREVRLTVDQYPPGPTVHRLLFRVGGQLQLVHTFSGQTQIGQILTWSSSQPVASVTAVRVETVASPSFVAWYEIEVLGS
jgi:hypothetical protein